MHRHPYHFCSNMRGTINVLRAGEEQGDLTSASQSSRQGQVASPQGRAAQRELTDPLPSSSSQILYHLNTSGPMRRAQACQVLPFSPQTAHKPGRCCDSGTSFILLSLLSSSTNVPSPPAEISLISCNGVSAHLQDFSCPPRDILLSVYHTSEPQES